MEKIRKRIEEDSGGEVRRERREEENGGKSEVEEKERREVEENVKDREDKKKLTHHPRHSLRRCLTCTERVSSCLSSST